MAQFLTDCASFSNSQGERLVPIIGMQSTRSFKTLPEDFKRAVSSVYNEFFTRQTDLWSQTAVQRLSPWINATGMLVCGEDLGMVPACTCQVLRQLRIFCLRVQLFSTTQHPNEYDYLTVITTSTHDTPVLRCGPKTTTCRARRAKKAMR
eukprot:TRINITY_DN2537_c0_g1_i26.p1 TRINITY_DN2537_c0_g1~~TRINITY_DN2537_c0_g1_i26.p1  ORF type:complete len:168 (-),score=16.96 TRINITY_DN2537_c0_g1_i26:273-722(-)